MDEKVRREERKCLSYLSTVAAVSSAVCSLYHFLRCCYPCGACKLCSEWFCNDTAFTSIQSELKWSHPSAQACNKTLTLPTGTQSSCSPQETQEQKGHVLPTKALSSHHHRTSAHPIATTGQLYVRSNWVDFCSLACVVNI